jgi:hypothetical protein
MEDSQVRADHAWARRLIGVSQSFAKFREKFASGAAGAEISRNLPLTAPLASQAHAVHMYRISME